MSNKQNSTNKNIIESIAERLPDEERIIDNSPLLRKLFFLAFSITALFTFFLAMKTGINADEDFQVNYSESLVKWYASAGQIQATKPENADIATGFVHRNAPMYYYGGLYEVVAGATNHALHFKADEVAYHNVRHLWVAIFGLLAMLFTALAAREVAGWKAAFIALGLMTLSPYFIGNVVMNPKDIPFCTGFAMSIYFMIVYFREMPAPRKSTLLGLILGFTIALGMRAGGILLIAYFGLFTIVHVLRNYNIVKFFANKGLLWSYVRSALVIIILGYLGALLFWPYGLISPLSNPFKALSEFEKLSQGIKVLFEGKNVISTDSPVNYITKSIFITTPIVISVGFVLGLLFCWRLFKRFNPTAVFIALFTSIFPVFYVIYKDSNMYNNWRHLLFIYPGIILTATFLFTYLYDVLAKKNRNFAYAFIAILVLGMAAPAYHILQNTSMPYIYYNETVGGVKGAFGNYEMDYWGISMREGTEYLEKQGVFNQKTEKPVVVATNMGYAGITYLTKKYGNKAKVMYVSYTDRYKFKWDYGLFISLFVDGSQLRSGQWPMKSGTAYTVTQNDVPLLAVMKQDTSQFTFKGIEAMKANNLPLALENLNAEVAQHPDNDLALERLVDCEIAAQRFPEAKRAAAARLKIAPESPSALNLMATTLLQAGDTKAAVDIFNQILKKNPNDEQARSILSKIYERNGR